jgi:hypothetical protein
MMRQLDKEQEPAAAAAAAKGNNSRHLRSQFFRPKSVCWLFCLSMFVANGAGLGQCFHFLSAAPAVDVFCN